MPCLTQCSIDPVAAFGQHDGNLAGVAESGFRLQPPEFLQDAASTQNVIERDTTVRPGADNGDLRLGQFQRPLRYGPVIYYGAEQNMLRGGRGLDGF